MKRHIMIGLLAMLVLTPVVEVFSDSTDTFMLLTPEEQEELGILAPMYVWEFGYCPSSAGGFTCRLVVANRTGQPAPIRIITYPSGQSPITRDFTVGAFGIAFADAADINCAVGLNCRLQILNPSDQRPVFDPAVIIFSTGGAPVSIQHPSVEFPVQ